MAIYPSRGEPIILWSCGNPSRPLAGHPSLSVELFRYRYHGEEGGEFECIFETAEKSTSNTVTEDKAADFTTNVLPRLGWLD